MNATPSRHFAIVAERYAPSGGGAERNVTEVARHLHRRGHTVAILAGATDGETLDGVAIEACPTGAPRTAGRLQRFTDWVEQRLANDGYDASLSVTSIAPATVVQPLGGTVRATLDRNIAMRDSAAARWAKRFAIALNPKYQTAMRIEQRVIRHPLVKRFAALSQFVANQLTNLYGVDPSRIVIVRNAVDLPPMDRDKRGRLRAAVRQRLHIDEATTVFLFAAFNPRLKGSRTLIRAMDRLRGEPVAVLAAGPKRGGGGLRGRGIHWLGPVDDMDELRAAADAVVMPTHYDPSSRVVLEAVRRDLPVIGSAYDGSVELLGDGAVVLADPSDDAALAGAMRRLTDPDERRLLARTAAAAVGEGAFTMARHVAELEALLVEVASEA